MRSYNKVFSMVYDRLYTNFPLTLAPFIHQYYLSHTNFSNHSLLDVCCGTGTLATYFLEKNFHVLGIDLSKDMIERAREKNRMYLKNGKAEFIVHDASDFAVANSFTLATSTFGSINHFDTIQKIRKCFSNINNALHSEGLFVFDIKMKSGFNHWNNIEIVDQDNLTFIFRGFVDESEQKVYVKNTGFLKDSENSSYERFDELIVNYWYSFDEIRNALVKAKFRLLEIFTFPTFLPLNPSQADSQDRLVIIAKKP